MCKFCIESVADVEHRIGEKHIVNLVIFIQILQRMDNFLRIERTNVVTFDERVGAINTVVRAAPFCLHVDHAGLVPVKSEQFLIKPQVRCVYEMFSVVDHNFISIPVYQAINTQVRGSAVEAHQQPVNTLVSFPMNPIVGLKEGKQFTGVNGKGRAADDQRNPGDLPDRVGNYLVSADETFAGIGVHIIDVAQRQSDVIWVEIH